MNKATPRNPNTKNYIWFFINIIVYFCFIMGGPSSLASSFTGPLRTGLKSDSKVIWIY